jgi:hypothetical protein
MRLFQSGRDRLKGAATVVLLYVVVGGGVGPAPAQAIPVAGDYVFIGSSSISGSFTSTGSFLSSWNFSSNILENNTWNSATDAVPFINSSTVFSSNNGMYWNVLNWDPDVSTLSAMFNVHALCCDSILPPVNVSYVAQQTVPVPDLLWLTLLVMLGIVILSEVERPF